MRKILSYAFAVSAGVAGLMCLSAAAQAAEISINCASEGKMCVVPNSSTTIAYGKSGAIVTTIGVTEIDCSSKAFKKDPLVGKEKSCTYSIDPDKINWARCAKDGETCSFTGARLVRYGSNNWVYGSFVNGVKCSKDTFGDPDKGTGKRCEIAAN